MNPGLINAALLIGFLVVLALAVVAVDGWLAKRNEVAALTEQRDQAERDRLQTEAAYRRLRAQAAQRRGQDTPRTSPDPRLRMLDGGDAS